MIGSQSCPVPSLALLPIHGRRAACAKTGCKALRQGARNPWNRKDAGDALGARSTAPVLRPAVVVAGLFAFLISWSEYVLTLLVGGGQVTTLPLLLFAAVGSTDTTAAAALALLVIAPPLAVVLAASRSCWGHRGRRWGGAWL